MKILVTGATGFIGRALTPYLVSRGHQVTVLARHPIDISGVDVLPISDITAVTEAHARGQQVVVHLAGQAHDNAADESSYRHVNVIGTEAITRSCVQAGVSRLVLLSSVKVHGDAPDDCLNARSATRADDAYGRSKLEAEGIVRAQTNLESVIVRIPLVYGEGVKGNFAALVKLVSSGLPLPFKSVTARRSYLGIDNLVDFLACCLDSPKVAGKVLYACDSEPLSLPELLQAVADAMSRRLQLVAIPSVLLRPTIGSMIGRKRANKLFNRLEIDLAETIRQTDWAPPYTTAQGLQRMFGHTPQSC